MKRRVLKDTNLKMLDDCLEEANVEKRVISIQDDCKTKVNRIIELDSVFLQRWGIMDYSLFLVVERRPRNLR